MSQEINTSYTTGNTLYATVLDSVGSIYHTGLLSFVTPMSSAWSNYTVYLTEFDTTGIYAGTMPAVPAGVYGITVYHQSSGSAATTDFVVGMDNIEWGGTLVIPLASRMSSGQIVTASVSGTVIVGGYSSGQDPATLVWAAVSRTLTSFSFSPTGVVSGYLTGQDPASLVWNNDTRTLTAFSFSPTGIVGGYISGQDPASMIWSYTSRTLTAFTFSPTGVVSAYIAGASPADLVLITPNNKLDTTSTGRVNINLAQSLASSGVDVGGGTVGRALQIARASGKGNWVLNTGTDTMAIYDTDGTLLWSFDLDPNGGPYVQRSSTSE